MARGVPAARSGAPLADAVTHKLVGCIPQLGCWMPWTAPDNSGRQVTPDDRPAVCSQTATAHLRAVHSNKLDTHIISRRGRSLPPLFTPPRSVHQNAESPLRVSALLRAPTPQGDPDFHRTPTSYPAPECLELDVYTRQVRPATSMLHSRPATVLPVRVSRESAPKEHATGSQPLRRLLRLPQSRNPEIL